MRSFSTLTLLLLPYAEASTAFLRTSTKGSAASSKNNEIYSSHDYWVDNNEQQESVADLYYYEHHVQAERQHQKQSTEHAQQQKANEKVPRKNGPMKKKTSSLHQMEHTTTSSVQPTSVEDETTKITVHTPSHAIAEHGHHPWEPLADPLHEPLMHNELDLEDAELISTEAHHEQEHPLKRQLDHNTAAQPVKVVENKVGSQCLSFAHTATAHRDVEEKVKTKQQQQHEKVQKAATQMKSQMSLATIDGSKDNRSHNNHKAKPSSLYDSHVDWVDDSDKQESVAYTHFFQHHLQAELQRRKQLERHNLERVSEGKDQLDDHRPTTKQQKHSQKPATDKAAPSLYDSHDYWMDNSDRQQSFADIYFYEHHLQAEQQHRQQQENRERQRAFAKEEASTKTFKAKEQPHAKPSAAGSSDQPEPQHHVMETRSKEHATVAQPHPQHQQHSIYESHDYWMDNTDEQVSVADFYFYNHHLQAERKHHHHPQQQQQHQQTGRSTPPEQHRRLHATTSEQPNHHRRLHETTKHKETWQLQKNDDADDEQQSEDYRMVGPAPTAALNAFESMAVPVPVPVETTSNNENAADVEDADDENDMVGLRGAQSFSRHLRAKYKRLEGLAHESRYFEEETTAGQDDGDRRDLLKESGRKATIGIVSAVVTAVAMILCAILTMALLRKRKSASQTKTVEKPSASTFFGGNDNNTERVTEEDVDEDVENNGEYSIGDYIKEARSPIKKSASAASSQAGIHSGRTVTVGTKSPRRSSSCKSVISTLTVVDLEEQADADDSAVEDENEASYSFSNIYSLISQLMNQQELPEEQEEDETTSRRSVKSESSTTLGGSLAFYENNSIVDVADRHCRSSRLEPRQPVEETEVAWTEFQRQSSGMGFHLEKKVGEDSDSDDDDASLREYLRRNYGVLSTKAQPSPTAKGRLEF